MRIDITFLDFYIMIQPRKTGNMQHVFVTDNSRFFKSMKKMSDACRLHYCFDFCFRNPYKNQRGKQRPVVKVVSMLMNAKQTHRTERFNFFSQ